MTHHINIVSKINGVGLDQDVRLLTDALESQGFTVSFSEHTGIKSLWRYLLRSKIFDANIFIERVFPCWMGLAKKNFVIPNQERFPRRLLPSLKGIDSVLCKTQHALEIFQDHHNNCQLIGFTSPDKIDNSVTKDYSRFFHLAGKSSVKGTEDILCLWQKHPQWPELVLVQHPSKAPASVPKNVRLYAQRLSDVDLNQLQNEIAMHLCLSRSEGWGHYIVEAMSTKSLVVTTDGAPMNELINSSRGSLVAVKNEAPRHLGVNYFVGRGSLESEIERLISLPDNEKKDLAEHARKWFEENQQRFSKTLSKVLISQL